MSTVREAPDTRLAWWRELPRSGKRAVVGAFLGFGLDSYDFWVFSLSLAAIGTTFHLNSADRGWLSTTTLVASALGGKSPFDQWVKVTLPGGTLKALSIAVRAP